MRYSRVCLALVASLSITSSASAVTMDWTFVGNPGNPTNPNTIPSYGAVDHAFLIGTYEVTNAQYTEFLNAVAAADPYGLYHPEMGDPSNAAPYPSIAGRGGITRTGSEGSYAYTAIAGREDLPVNWIGFYDAIRFANWLNNGQGSSDTEAGAYTISGTGTPVRNTDALIFLPSIDEWHKAGFYDASSQGYFSYPTGTHEDVRCGGPTSFPNSANCLSADLTPVGSFPGSPSPYGTFDQAGNVSEWVDTPIYDFDFEGSNRWVVGGSFDDPSHANSFGSRAFFYPADEWATAFWMGFRVAMIPEPGTGFLVFAGLIGLVGWRRSRA